MSDQSLAIVSLTLGPIVALVAAIITARVMRRNNKDELHINTKDAETNQFTALTEGYTETFRQLRLDMQDMQKRVIALEAEKKVLAIENSSDRALFLAHLTEVEKLVPVPPGPPARPFNWA